MIKKILIANRGEISCRIIKTAKRMGIKTLAVYSEADRHALHVQLADEAIYLGPSPSKESYLRGELIIQLAIANHVDAIHPGYGFLSENADFAEACQQNNLTFIGPPVGAIEAMGSKSAAKTIMQQANVPLVPGYHGEDQSPELLKSHADAMGYPVLLKAAAGGGGKGMRQVWDSSEFDSALASAKREALSSFNDDVMLIEKYLTQPRHVEIQIFCDQQGNGVYLFERDCSIQRRHQKVVEEAPAPGLPESIRQKMGEAALVAAQAINYVGAGTVEFLLDTDGQFYFMEMNTRLQVEHPVTEMITGQDLVEWQIRVANQESLPLTQAQLTIKGHALEVRIYAEDPQNDFLPSTGNLSLFSIPSESEFVRNDVGVIQGFDVSVYYDPMLAKLIVWDESREKALARMSNALNEYYIDGVKSNVPFLQNVINHHAFKTAEFDTGFIEKYQATLLTSPQVDVAKVLPLAALNFALKRQQYQNVVTEDKHSPWSIGDDWRANENHYLKHILYIEDQPYPVEIMFNPKRTLLEITCLNRVYQCSGHLVNNRLFSTINGVSSDMPSTWNDNMLSLFMPSGVTKVFFQTVDLGLDANNSEKANFVAPMNGTVSAILVNANELVRSGQNIIVIEAMKMEHTIKATQSGKVAEFFYSVGDLVNGGDPLLNFIADE